MSIRKQLIDAVGDIRKALSVIETFSEPPHMKGYRFEKHFMTECRLRGLKAHKVTGGHVDMRVCGKRVQCKCVTPNANGDVFIQPGQRTWYLPSDFDVLAMQCADSIYIIPMDSLPKTNGHVRIQLKPFRMRRFINAWGVFLGNEVAAEPTLFDSQEEATDGR